MAKVTMQYWAAAKEAAGVEREPVEARTLAEALDVVVARRGDDARLRSVLATSSFLVDGASAGRSVAADLVLPDAAVIEVLPQFAGGLPQGKGGLGDGSPQSREVPGGVPPGQHCAFPAVLRHTGWITPYSVRTSTFRSHIPAVPHLPSVPHEPARTSHPSGSPRSRGGARR